MTSDVQREALRALAEIWELSPEVRLGQLMAHLGFLGEVQLNRGLGYIDDDELISVMYRHKEELLARLDRTADQEALSAAAASDISGAHAVSSSQPEVRP
jgi:hypothetical protein